MLLAKGFVFSSLLQLALVGGDGCCKYCRSLGRVVARCMVLDV